MERHDHTTCDLCGGRVVHVHCEYRCKRCGYVRDCSDPDR
jgi:ribosomal protein L37E